VKTAGKHGFSSRLRPGASDDKMPPRPTQGTARIVATAAVADVERGSRIAAIDLVRGIALAGMVVYHFSYDLAAERLISADVVDEFGWKLFARAVAGTFLALVGVNLVLANRRGLRPWPFLRRLALVAGGAALVTLSTLWFEPGAFVFFGILHEIALASVLAVPFLWAPPWLTAAVAAVVIALPNVFTSPLFDTPALWWVGLSTASPVTVDYVPVFPFFGVVLAGVVGGRLLLAYGSDSAFARWRPGNWWERSVIVAGRWSLLIYLVHQPVLVGALMLATPLLPANEAAVRRDFTAECNAACITNSDADYCTALCGCLFENLHGTDLYNVPSLEAMTLDQRQRWDTIVGQCRGGAAMPPPPEH
jgi:uncharacterized membrane protein